MFADLLRLHFSIDKLLGVIARDRLDGRYLLIVEKNAIELIRLGEHFGTEGGSDELRRGRQLVYHRCDGGSILGIEIGVDLSK